MYWGKAVERALYVYGVYGADKRISVAVITTGNSSAMEIVRKIIDAYLVEKGLMKEEVAKVKVPVKAQVAVRILSVLISKEYLLYLQIKIKR